MKRICILSASPSRMKKIAKDFELELSDKQAVEVMRRLRNQRYLFVEQMNDAALGHILDVRGNLD